MRKTLMKNLYVAVITTCLTLACSGTSVRANGQIGSGSFTDPLPSPTTTAAPGGGVLGSGNAISGPDTGGSSNVMSAIGEFLIDLFG